MISWLLAQRSIHKDAKQETAAAGLRGSRPSSAKDIVMNFFSGLPPAALRNNGPPPSARRAAARGSQYLLAAAGPYVVSCSRSAKMPAVASSAPAA